MGGGGPLEDAADIGLEGGFAAVFRRFPTDGTTIEVVAALYGLGLETGKGGAMVGGLGAAPPGGFGTELLDDSGSDVYEESRFAVPLLVSARRISCGPTYPLYLYLPHASSTWASLLRIIQPIVVVAQLQMILRYPFHFDHYYSVLYFLPQALAAQVLLKASTFLVLPGQRLMEMDLMSSCWRLLSEPIGRS